MTGAAVWRWLIWVLPLAFSLMLLGRVWFHPAGIIGYDQIANERVIENAGGYLLHPGSAPWAWPAAAPACLTDHMLGLAALELPWRLVGLPWMTGLWLTTATILALNGTLLALLLRRWGIAAPAALAAAVLVVGLPVFVQRLQHATNVQMCWVLAWGIAWDAWSERPDRYRGALLAAAGMGLAIMPATILQYLTMALPLLAVVALTQRPPTWRTLLLGGACQLPGLALALWIYIPYLQHSYPPNVVFPSPWQDLGRPLGQIAWSSPRGQGADYLATPGPAPMLGLVGLGVAALLNHRRVLALVLLAVVLVDLAGAATFGSWSLLDHLRGVPLLGSMRAPSRFAIPACFVAVVGVALLIELALAHRRRWLAAALVAVAWCGQMAVDGGPVVPLRFIANDTVDLAAVSASARLGPVLALPIGILDDQVALASGRSSAGTILGIPTEWEQVLFEGTANGGVARMTLVLTALHRQGLAAVITQGREAMPGLAGILTGMGARPRATGSGDLVWWELPSPPPGPWPSAVEISVQADQTWQLDITGEPGAPPIEGRIVSPGGTWVLVPFLPGVLPLTLSGPLAAGLPSVRFDRPIPVHLPAGASPR